MPVLRAKTLTIVVGANSAVTSYTFPNIFEGSTPDFAQVQSTDIAGVNVYEGSPAQDNRSVRVSNGFVTSTGTVCTANWTDDNEAACIHSQQYSYINLYRSRGVITLIPNGFSVSSDIANTFADTQLVISVVGGTDIANAAIMRVDQGEGTKYGNFAMPFDGVTVMMMLGGGGTEDEIYYGGFNDSQGVMFCDNKGAGGKITRTGRCSYIRDNEAQLTEPYPVVDGVGSWGMGSEYSEASNYGEGYAMFVKDPSTCVDWEDGTFTTQLPVQYTMSRMNHGKVYNPTLGVYEDFNVGGVQDSISPYVKLNGQASNVGDNNTCVYILCLAFNYVNENVLFYGSQATNPYQINNNWSNTTQDGGIENNYSTKDQPNEMSTWYLGGSNDTIQHWPSQAKNQTDYARMSQLPTTWGFITQAQIMGNGDVGDSVATLQFDGRQSELENGDTVSGYGVGWARQGNSYTKGWANSYLYRDMSLAAQISQTMEGFKGGRATTIDAGWSQTRFVSDADKIKYKGQIQQFEVSLTVDRWEAVPTDFAEVWMDVSALGRIVGLFLLVPGYWSDSYYIGEKFYARTSIEMENGKYETIEAEGYIDGVDHNGSAAQEGRTNFRASLEFEADGSLAITPLPRRGESGNVFTQTYQMPTTYLMLAASDGSGTGDVDDDGDKETGSGCEDGGIAEGGMITFTDRRKLRDGIRNCNLDYNFAVLNSKVEAGSDFSDGVDGAPGADGPQGNEGLPGQPGSDGQQGTPGTPGNNGNDGGQGVQGIQGPKGDKGDQGDQGFTGLSGVAGVDGTKWFTGVDNPPEFGTIQGSQNNDLYLNSTSGNIFLLRSAGWVFTGDNILGPQGEDGTSINLEGTVANEGALPDNQSEGDLWITADTGDGWVSDGNNNWTNVGPIKGPKGDTGSTGAIGPVGQDGSKGVDGKKGDTGDTGAEGPQGIQGIQGIHGDQGGEGLQGIQGEDGIQGIQGNTGDTGGQGAEGSVGPQGPRGEQGAKGDVGADSTVEGPQGPTGDAGATGQTGPQGEAGLAGQNGADGRDGVDTSINLDGGIATSIYGGISPLLCGNAGTF